MEVFKIFHFKFKFRVCFSIGENTVGGHFNSNSKYYGKSKCFRRKKISLLWVAGKIRVATTSESISNQLVILPVVSQIAIVLYSWYDTHSIQYRAGLFQEFVREGGHLQEGTILYWCGEIRDAWLMTKSLVWCRMYSSRA